jgi:hypothetical protein
VLADGPSQCKTLPSGLAVLGFPSAMKPIKDYCVACNAAAHLPHCPTLRPPADMVYHPNLQCSCVGCTKARGTKTPVGTLVLDSKTGMPSCAGGDQCEPCISLRGPDPARKAVDEP